MKNQKVIKKTKPIILFILLSIVLFSTIAVVYYKATLFADAQETVHYNGSNGSFS